MLPSAQQYSRFWVPEIATKLTCILAHKRLKAARRVRHMTGWERDLNAVVYELHGLTEEEIGIVEESFES